MVTGGDDSTAIIWDVETGEILNSFKIRTTNGVFNPIVTVDYSPDGNKIIAGCRYAPIMIWDVNTSEQLLRIGAGCSSVEFSPDGTQWVVGLWTMYGTQYGAAIVSDVNTGEDLYDCYRHDNSVEDVMFSPDGTKILTCSTDKTAKLWQYHGKESIRSSSIPIPRCSDIIFQINKNNVIITGISRVQSKPVELTIVSMAGRLLETLHPVSLKNGTVTCRLSKVIKPGQYLFNLYQDSEIHSGRFVFVR
jgi:WD40 repeat protein